MSDLAARASGRLVPPIRRSTWAIGAIVVTIAATTFFAFWWIGVSGPNLVAGLQDSVRLLDRMLPPRWPDAGQLATLLLETFLIGIAGTLLAAILSVPLAFAASARFEGPRVLGWLAQAVILVTRGVPTLIFAIIFVRIFGLGPLPGALAIAVHSIGMIGKQASDALEEVDPVPAEAVRACGASRFQTAVTAVLPRVMPQLLGFTFYRLDINLRASSVLGLVGAGGIGMALQTAMGSLNYRRATGIVVIIIALILALEVVSAVVRRRLSAHSGGSTRTMLYPGGSDPADPGWDRGRVVRTVLGWGTVLLFLFALSRLGFSLDRVLRAGDQVAAVVGGFWPPAFSQDILVGVMESLLMAVAGTAVGVVVGLPLAVLTARTVTPLGPFGWLLRGLMVMVRGIPDLVYALIFVAALGLGAFAGFLTLSITCTALAAKFFTDALEDLDLVPAEALSAVGAARPSVFMGATWPQFVPMLVASTLFVIDLSLRESIVLGIVGAGGIGYRLHESVASVHYDATAAILIAIILVVAVLEGVARSTRKYLI